MASDERAEAVAEPLASYEIAEATRKDKKWTLSLYPDHLRLQPPEGDPQEVDRAKLPEQVQMTDGGWLLPPLLFVTLGKKRLGFRLSPELYADIRSWIGPPTPADLKIALKRRFAWVLPAGFLFMLTALPVGNLPLEPVSLGLGLALIVTGMFAKLAPHRILFVLDTLWFSGLAADSVRLLVEDWSWWRLVLLFLQLKLVESGWREYRRFAPQPAAEGDAAS
jgi:hypothetical protein